MLVAAALLVTLFHFHMEPLRWRFGYLPRGQAGSLAGRVRDALFCTALATYVLPFKLGIPLRIALLRRESGLGLHFIGVVVALDGSISLMGWIVGAAACAWIAALHWEPPWYVWLAGIAAALVLVAGVTFHARVRGRWLERWRAAVALLERPARRCTIAASIVAVDVFSYGLRHAILLWLVTGNVELTLAGGAIGVVATFAGIVSGLPMGVLGYDASLIALLATAGVSIDQALAVALVNRGLNLASAAILGVPAGVRLGLGAGIVSLVRKLRDLSHGKS